MPNPKNVVMSADSVVLRLRFVPCPGYPGYWVCDNGQVFSGELVGGELTGLRPMSVSRGAGPRGVGRTFLPDPTGSQNNVSVGRLVLTTFPGPPHGPRPPVRAQ